MSGITGAVGTFKRMIDNPVSRKILRYAARYCRKDGSSRLETALKIYSGIIRPEEACIACRIFSKPISTIIKRGAISFGADPSEIKEKLKDPYWRRALISVVKGLAYFGVRKPFVPGAPFLVVWDVTYSCNLRCKHCYANAGRPWPDELSTEEAKRVIDILDRAGVVAIAWSGGEPLVRPDIYELSKYASDKGMYVAMATNGTLIDEKTADRLKDSGVRFLQISLDGLDPRTHDEFRGISGAWKRTVEGIRTAVRKGFFVNVATTITRYNLKEIPELIKFCDSLGVQWFMMYNFVPTGRGIFIKEEDISPEEREELLKLLWNLLKERRMRVQVLSTAPQFARVALEGRGEEIVLPTHFYNAHLGSKLESLADFIGGCGAGRFYIGLWPNGDVRPCVFFPMKIGNILEIGDGFDAWWRTNPVLNDLRNKDELQEPCGSCPFRYVCGGCRARAYGYFGDYMAPDPGCILAARPIELTRKT